MAEEGFKFKPALLLPFPPHQVRFRPVLHNLLVSVPARTACTALGVFKVALRWNNTAGIDIQIRTLSLRQKSDPSFISVLKNSYPFHKVEKGKFSREVEGLRCSFACQYPRMSISQLNCSAIVTQKARVGLTYWNQILLRTPVLFLQAVRILGKPCEHLVWILLSVNIVGG